MNTSHAYVRERYAQLKQQDIYAPEYSWPSMLGQCLRGAWLKKQGATPEAPKSAELMEHFITGVIIEQGLVKMYELVGEEEGYTVASQDSLVNEEFKVRGKPDLLLKKEDEELLRLKEIKSVNDRSYAYRLKLGEIAQSHHVLQLQCYMWMLGMPIGSESDLIYRKMSWPDFMEVKVTLTQEAVDQIEREFGLLRDAKSIEEIPLVDPVVRQKKLSFSRWGSSKDQGFKWDVNWQAGYCDYHKTCAGENWREEAEAKVKENNNVEKQKAAQAVDGHEDGEADS